VPQRPGDPPLQLRVVRPASQLLGVVVELQYQQLRLAQVWQHCRGHVAEVGEDAGASTGRAQVIRYRLGRVVGHGERSHAERAHLERTTGHHRLPRGVGRQALGRGREGAGRGVHRHAVPLHQAGHPAEVVRVLMRDQHRAELRRVQAELAQALAEHPQRQPAVHQQQRLVGPQ
jgi:hypothetical protein